MSGNLPQAKTDIRKQYTHQAFDITFGGVPKEAGRRLAGYGTSLPATYTTQFWVAIDTRVNGEVRHSLPPGLYSPIGAGFGSTVVKGGNGAPTCTMKLTDNLQPEVLLHDTTPLALGATANTPVQFEEELKFDNDRLFVGRTLIITVANATDDGDPLNFALVGLDFRVVPTGWK